MQSCNFANPTLHWGSQSKSGMHFSNMCRLSGDPNKHVITELSGQCSNARHVGLLFAASVHKVGNVPFATHCSFEAMLCRRAFVMHILPFLAWTLQQDQCHLSHKTHMGHKTHTIHNQTWPAMMQLQLYLRLLLGQCTQMGLVKREGPMNHINLHLQVCEALYV